MRPIDLANLVLLGAIWGGSFPLLRYAAPHFGPFALIAVRLVAAAAVVFALWRVGREIVAHWRRLLMLGVINTAVPFTLFAFAALMIPSGVNSLLNATTPIFGALIARFWLGEMLSVRRWIGIALSFAGVGAIVYEAIGFQTQTGPLASRAVLGVAAGLCAGFCYGLAGCYTRKYLHMLSSSVLTAGSVGAAALLLVPPAAVLWPTVTPPAGAWVAALVLGLLCTAAAYLLYFRLLRNVGAARAMTVTFLIPVFGILWGALFFDEPLGGRLLVFCGVVLAGTALAAGLFDRRIPAAGTRT
jgi:drug/metabolite transporter (DMT)-like permease